MNNLKLYAIYDRCAMQFQPPFAAVNDAVAIRMFATNCKHPEVSAIAGDLDLYYVGEIDYSTGEITPAEGKPVFLHRLTLQEVNDNGE